MPPLPQPPQPSASAAGFCLMPAVVPDGGEALRQLYHWAYEQDRAVVRPSLPERDLLAGWN